MNRVVSKRLFTLACVLALTMAMGVAQGLCAEKFWVEAGGYVLYKNERGDVVRKDFTRYVDVKFEERAKQVGFFFCRVDAIETQIPVRGMRAVRLDPNNNFAALVTMDAMQHEVKVERDLAQSLTNMDHLEIAYHNSVTNQGETGYILGRDIVEVVFADTSRIGY